MSGKRSQFGHGFEKEGALPLLGSSLPVGLKFR
jgi:hypothetical protein